MTEKKNFCTPCRVYYCEQPKVGDHLWADFDECKYFAQRLNTERCSFFDCGRCTNEVAKFEANEERTRVNGPTLEDIQDLIEEDRGFLFRSMLADLYKKEIHFNPGDKTPDEFWSNLGVPKANTTSTVDMVCGLPLVMDLNLPPGRLQIVYRGRKS